MTNCDICNSKIGLGKFKYKFKSGQVIDSNCRQRLELPDTLLKYKNNFESCRDKVKVQIDHEIAAEGFNPTTTFGDRIAINDETNEFVVHPIKVPLFKATPSLFRYDELTSFDVIEDGNTTKGGLFRAAIGGTAFGGAGAVVGAVTGKTNKTISEGKIKLNLKDLNQPYYMLDILPNEMKKTSMLFKSYEKSMNDAIAGLQHILASQTTAVDSQTSNLNDLRELKALLDDGIISKQEFDTKKSQILGI